jgi:hypothetical protein
MSGQGKPLLMLAQSTPQRLLFCLLISAHIMQESGSLRTIETL